MKIITFLSDFGLDDWFIAAVKGEIYKRNPSVQIVDITHTIAAQDIRAAAFMLSSVYQNFPKRTIHLAVVDPGVGSTRKSLIVTSNSHFFVGPDNGVFSYIYNARSQVYEIRSKHKTSVTFHARDVFGPVVGSLSQGKRASSLGKKIERYRRFPFPRPERRGNMLSGEILYIDRFGNLITNISETEKVTSLYYRKKKIPCVSFYGEGRLGSLVCVKGSTGFYEIAVNKGNAQKVTRAQHGSRIYAKLNS